MSQTIKKKRFTGRRRNPGTYKFIKKVCDMLRIKYLFTNMRIRPNLINNINRKNCIPRIRDNREKRGIGEENRRINPSNY